MELKDQYTHKSMHNLTRSHWSQWISPYAHEDEYLFYGYNNMTIRTFSSTKGSLVWRIIGVKYQWINIRKLIHRDF